MFDVLGILSLSVDIQSLLNMRAFLYIAFRILSSIYPLIGAQPFRMKHQHHHERRIIEEVVEIEEIVEVWKTRTIPGLAPSG